MQGSGEDLFDFMALKLEEFMFEHDLIIDDEDIEAEQEVYHLGFTFSFPTRQKSLSQAELTGWTKGYSCEGVEGEDVGLLLKQSIAKRPKLKIEVQNVFVAESRLPDDAKRPFSKVDAILNDTTGCLMACAYKHTECAMGVIVGTGTNASYVESLQNVDLYEGEKPLDSSCVVINTEWGAFGNTGSLEIVRTQYDHQLDKNSINPGKQVRFLLDLFETLQNVVFFFVEVYEKLISGMYLGELTRLLIVDAIQKKILNLPLEIFQKSRVFDTKHISEIEDDERGEFVKMKAALIEVGVTEETFDQMSVFDKKSLRFLCECVSDRGAKLAGAGVAALANKMSRTKLTVGMDGSVYKFHPCFGRKMKAVARKLVCNCIDFKMVLSEDGSGRGAALAVAAATTKFKFAI